MSGWSLVIFALLTPPHPAGPDAEALVSQLGSTRYADREAATRALEGLGHEALSPLRAARSARDPEVRTRAAELIERIESSLLIRPTKVVLDFQNRPLPDVVRTIGARTGMPPLLDPDDHDKWSSQRISLIAEAPVSYWTAMDRLCAASRRLRAGVGPAAPATGRGAAPSVFLFDPGEGARLTAPTSDWGPFRVKVSSLHYQRDRMLDVAPGAVGEPLAAEQFHAQLQVLAEPRLLIGPGGNARILEAVDDLGQSLRAAAATADPDEGILGLNEFNVGGTLQFPVVLRYPEHPGRVIRTLRGVVPVTVAARKPDPLEVPLVGSAGKTFLGGDVTVAIHEVRKADPNVPQTTLELTVRSRDGAALPTGASGRHARTLPTGSDFLEQQIEVVDARGKPFVLFSQESSPQGDSVRLTLMLLPTDEASVPAKLHYYGLTRTTADVEFSFRDVPMP